MCWKQNITDLFAIVGHTFSIIRSIFYPQMYGRIITYSGFVGLINIRLVQVSNFRISPASSFRIFATFYEYFVSFWMLLEYNHLHMAGLVELLASGILS